MEREVFHDFGLPIFLEESIHNYQQNENSSLWDCYYCELQSDINVAEVEQMISSEQANYLRKKYLESEREYD